MTVPASFVPIQDGEPRDAAQGLQDGDMDVDPRAEPGAETAAIPEPTDDDLQKLHSLLLETQITSGKLVCGNCGHEYKVLEGIPNFLLPAHLV